MKFEDFVKTGRVTPIAVYLKENPNVKLNPNCAEVVMYTHDFIIQVLKSNDFYIKKGKREIQHKVLDAVESALWYLYAEKVINKLK
jgi:hypothetical protein